MDFEERGIRGVESIEVDALDQDDGANILRVTRTGTALERYGNCMV